MVPDETIRVEEITRLHARTVEQWHEYGIDNSYEGFLLLVCNQHQQNYRLWHQEDIARSRDVCDAEIAQVKRNIDRLNQARNDMIEQLDDALIHMLQAADVRPAHDAPLNTETPGSVIDRLSIQSLRIYHMHQQADRAEASRQHRDRALARLEVLDQQHADLSQALVELLDDIFVGRKLLKVYRQYKMYNDPTMNPYLYKSGRKAVA